MSEEDRRAAEEPPPFEESLCHRCAACRYVKTKRSLFILCNALPNKYPAQPVLACAAYSPSEAPSR